MRKLKRIIALLTVALFLLSLAAPASAATKEDAFGRLNALKVAVGDATGNPQYDKNFTRAEAAAIMVNLSGMNAAINAAKGPTKFKDVPASHWASGVINLAVGSGIIKGYPDGTFKPDANVTYAEMSAMLVGVLGYTPKLQGTWPSNVIGKAAQLGLLDGVNVTDYNAAAVRSNVFLASDNALDVKPLKETKDGYDEDTKTLMESKLNVTKLEECTVTSTPAFGGMDKQKVTLTPTTAGHAAIGPVEVLDGINPDDYFGLRVEAWENSDNKIFFFNVKTSASDIINDSIKEFRDAGNNVLTANGAAKFQIGLTGGIMKATDAGATAIGYIKLDKADKVIGVNNAGNAGVQAATDTAWYVNWVKATNGSGTIGLGSSVKVILGGDGKAAYVIYNLTSTGLVDSVDTANEKINFDSDASKTGSITLKDEKYLVFRNGKAATLADLKKGDVVDYIDQGGSNANVAVVYANDKTQAAKITGILDDGMSKDNSSEMFKFQVGDTVLGGAKTIYVSTNNGDSYTAEGNSRNALTSDFNNILNKDVTLKFNKAGKVTHIIAGSATDSSDVPVLVKYVKKVTSTDTRRYIYVAKFDGTQTYYEVTKDTKIDGIKVNESALKQGTNINASEGDWSAEDGPRLVPNSVTADPGAPLATGEIRTGAVVKLNLNSDNTVNEIKTYGTDLENGAGYTVSKDNATFQVTGGTNLVLGDDVKTIKVKAQVANVALDNIAAIDDYGTHGVIDDVDAVSASTLKSLNGTYAANAAAVVKDGGKAKYVVLLDKDQAVASSSFFGVVLAKGTNSAGNGYLSVAHDGKTENIEGSGANPQQVIAYTLTTDGKLNVVTVQAAKAVYTGYTTYKVDSISDRQVKLIPSTDLNYNDVSGHDQYIIIDTAKTQFWDITTSGVAPVKITANDVIGHYVNVYDAWDKDGNVGTDNVYDFLMMIKK